MSWEAEVESRLYHYIFSVLEKRGFTVDGVKFDEPKTQFPVNGRRADLAVILAEGKKPLLIIETKRKYEEKGYYRAVRNIMPTSRVVIDQALWYAIYSGAPYFATTNGRVFALFKRPEAGEKFSFDTHRILVRERVTINEEFAEEILVTVARLYRQVPVAVTPLDWSFIVVLRDFVTWLSEAIEPLIRKKLKTDEEFKAQYERFAEEIGYKPDAGQLAKEMAYVFMNKIVFYKVLERHFKELGERKLKPISAPDAKAYLDLLYRYFAKAVEVTGDFEPVFYTGIYDEIQLPDDPFVLEGINAFIEDMEHHRLEDLGSDIVGFIYEELIPAAERHALGQFYTPPAIAELITKWAVRNADDKVLDPGCGSGTFLVKAYKRLLELKGYREPTERAHKEILRQLYAFDINPFPLHLTALNLSSRYIRAPSTEVNTIHTDFFKVEAEQKVVTPYVVKTLAGEAKREIPIPKFDAVIANPPYTRWVEIPRKTKDAIIDAIGDMLKKYGLSGGIGNETGIYVHFIMHAGKFLKKNGKLGMIVSNSWLQSDYGINFANFLLDNFKVKVVIDFNQRLFRIPLIATCVLLLEKEDDQKEREHNQTAFVYVDREAQVEEILDAIENPNRWKESFLINVVEQTSLPRNEKWIKILFKTDELEKALLTLPLITRMGALFTPRYGNISGVSARGGTGADKFFYLTKEDAQKWGITRDYLFPLLISPRYSKYFTFSEKDWRKLNLENKPCYVFICHKPKSELPKNLVSFIEWGETTPLVRVKEGEKPKTANQSTASKMRGKNKSFFGWYDLGEILNTNIFTMRRAQYFHRFILTPMSLAFDDSLITLIAKDKTSLTQDKIDALLAYLNSDFTRFFIEIYGRSTGGGVIELDINSLAQLPILNVNALEKGQLKKLSELFKELESEARKTKGVDTQENLEYIQKIVDEINSSIACFLGLEKKFVENLRMIVKIMAERRIARTLEAKPEAVKGEEEPRIRPPKKPEKGSSKEPAVPLDKFLT
ncbi:N-6 DNA methylase [Candidatus Bathyarchaeota archaeon]|nr:N-6 DNA methylase [Candidatus Bathyarchaeota archaeon]